MSLTAGAVIRCLVVLHLLPSHLTLLVLALSTLHLCLVGPGAKYLVAIPPHTHKGAHLTMASPRVFPPILASDHFSTTIIAITLHARQNLLLR